MDIPFFRPSIGDDEIREVAETLRSGWLTTGPRVRRFEEEFAAAVGARHAIAVNSCTAALHLALEALGIRSGDRILVPTMTFAATAEVIRYLDAEPVLVDCDPETLLMDLDGAYAAADRISSREGGRLKAIIPVHVGGIMVDMDGIGDLADTYALRVIEDAAHSFPARWRPGEGVPWRTCGQGDSEVACFSFYANKCITTGEGGMAVTHDPELAERMRIMSLHGISKDAWKRFTSSGSWYYEIIAPGFKYNMTDVAASVGIHQLKQADSFRDARAAVARAYAEGLSDCAEVDLPKEPENRTSSWHLYAIRLKLDRLKVDRAAFIDALKERGIGCSVHWMPLHLHPYYQDTFGHKARDFPAASAVWERLISLPIFPSMKEEEVAFVIHAVRDLCRLYRR